MKKIDYKKIEILYKAIANKRRLRILFLLFLKEKKIKVGDISYKIKLSIRSTSRHLQILKNIGLIESEQIKLESYYDLTNLGKEIIKQIKTIL